MLFTNATSITMNSIRDIIRRQAYKEKIQDISG